MFWVNIAAHLTVKTTISLGSSIHCFAFYWEVIWIYTVLMLVINLWLPARWIIDRKSLPMLAGLQIIEGWRHRPAASKQNKLVWHAELWKPHWSLDRKSPSQIYFFEMIYACSTIKSLLVNWYNYYLIFS